MGDYLVLGPWGEGGMGTVYAAWQPELDSRFALKVPKPELVSTAEGLAIFHNEAATLARLKHQNITRVHTSGTQDGQPYFVMEFLEGGSLDDEERPRDRSEKDVLALMLQIAGAVQFAQERGVLHCDLKAANVLFDDDGNPYVCDFGLARKLARAGSGGQSLRGGTRGWMAPEQLGDLPVTEGAPTVDVTQATDVFSLGVLLHWLLEGRQLPFGDGADYAERVRHQPRTPPGRFAPGLRWALRAISHKAMQALADDRYKDAAEFVDDLERAKNKKVLKACRTPPWGRVWLWTNRHPIVAVAGCTVLALLLVSAYIAARGMAQHEDTLRQQVLDMNAYAARGQAAVVLYKLRDHADTLLKVAADPAVQGLALTRSPEGPPLSPYAPLDPTNTECAQQRALADPSVLERWGGFDMLNVHNPRGCARARSHPTPAGYEMRSYAWRDYFGGARGYGLSGQARAYVAHSFMSSVIPELRFSIATPLFRDRRWIGTLVAGITVGSTLALPTVESAQTKDRMTVLLAPFDGEGGPTEVGYKHRYAFLYHPKLPRGAQALLGDEYTKRLRTALGPATPPEQQFDLPPTKPIQERDYRDTVVDKDTGTADPTVWLGAFAPVGNTGYFVLVQTREEAAIRPSSVLLHSVMIGFIVLGGLALLLFVTFAVWASRRNGIAPPIRHHGHV